MLTARCWWHACEDSVQNGVQQLQTTVRTACIACFNCTRLLPHQLSLLPRTSPALRSCCAHCDRRAVSANSLTSKGELPMTPPGGALDRPCSSDFNLRQQQPQHVQHIITRKFVSTGPTLDSSCRSDPLQAARYEAGRATAAPAPCCASRHLPPCCAQATKRSRAPYLDSVVLWM